MSSKLPEITLPKSLEVQWHDEVALLRIVRPEKRNALDDPTVLGIDTFFSSIPEHVKAVVVEAGGENFSAGLDLSEMTERNRRRHAFHDVAHCVRQDRIWARSRCVGAQRSRCRRRSRIGERNPYSDSGKVRLLCPAGRTARNLCRRGRFSARATPDRSAPHG